MNKKEFIEILGKHNSYPLVIKRLKIGERYTTEDNYLYNFIIMIEILTPKLLKREL